MEEQPKSKMTLFTKISIIINTLLFGITGIIYLTEPGRKSIGYVLLAAGVLNVLSMFFTIHMKNYFFAILYFIFATASLIVCIDFLSKSNNNIGIVWLVITLIYMIIGFILLYRLKNSGKKV
jgi:hypothetical protein